MLTAFHVRAFYGPFILHICTYIHTPTSHRAQVCHMRGAALAYGLAAADIANVVHQFCSLCRTSLSLSFLCIRCCASAKYNVSHFHVSLNAARRHRRYTIHFTRTLRAQVPWTIDALLTSHITERCERTPPSRKTCRVRISNATRARARAR